MVPANMICLRVERDPIFHCESDRKWSLLAAGTIIQTKMNGPFLQPMDSFPVNKAMSTSASCANRKGKLFPTTEPRIVDGKMKHDSANGFLNPDCEFQQAFS
jgi:hypothetical protein